MTVKRWGSEVPLKGQKLKVKKGDIIFAKRNAYLKRVALAPFDGIFSAHGMVIRPVNGLVIPEFLPFFMQSDVFMERAVAISEGSLSPTIKWKILAEQKFLIPFKEKQETLLNLLSEVDRNIDALELTAESQEQLVEAIVNDALLCPRKVKQSSLSIGQACEEKRIRVSPEDFNQESCYVGFEHITPKNYWNINHSDLDGVVSQKFRFETGDILYGKIRPYLRKSALAQFDGICSSDLVVLKPRSKDLGIILAALFSSESFAQLSMNTAKGTKMPRADWKILKQLKIAKLSPVEVEQISSTLIACKDSYESLQHKKRALLDMKMNLLKE